MGVPPKDQLIERIFSPRVEAERPSTTSDLEKEVTQLYDDLREPLLRYISSFGLSLQDAEEIIQEAFLSLFLHLRAGKPRSNIRGWIFRVAHNLGLKRREKNHRALKIMVNSDECPVESQLDTTSDPEQQASLLQRRKRLLAVLNALPEQDRQCLSLRAEGLRYREIAQVLEISLGSVALSLARSLSRLGRADER
jgi:RNA polymerase sigma-70 factor (ECF subfamily)